jgi:hypothetical protein
MAIVDGSIHIHPRRLGSGFSLAETFIFRRLFLIRGGASLICSLTSNIDYDLISVKYSSAPHGPWSHKFVPLLSPLTTTCTD